MFKKLVENLAKRIIEASSALIVLAVIGTLALQSLFSSSMPSVPSSVNTLITTLVGILFAVGVAYAFYKIFGSEQ